MKIKTFPIEKMTIEEFADKYGLVMEVHERKPPYKLYFRYYARFSDCEVADQGFLVSIHGNGNTPEAAIADYAREISGKALAENARSSQRRDIQVPTLVDHKVEEDGFCKRIKNGSISV
jgi:hypothetical protein